MNYSKFNTVAITVSNLFIFVLFGITIIAMIIKADKRHRLDHSRLRFKGWPIYDETEQARNTGNCDASQPSDISEHCQN
tara:strand:- start:491 stop:727 length:237 start_codon:yes stop_codon:yes gene_type:complete